MSGICYRLHNNNIEILIAKRSSLRQLYPDLWECGGGQVNFNENFEEAVIRQMKEELGIIVKKVIPFSVYEIFVPEYEQKKIPGVAFYCMFDSYVDSKGAMLDKSEFTECKWVKADEIDNYEVIPGVANDIKQALRILTFKF